MRATFAVLGLLLLSLAPLPALPVSLEAPPALQPAAVRLLSRHPLSPGIWIDPSSPPGSSDAVIFREGDAPGFKIAEISAMVPVVRLWEQPLPLTRAQAESGVVRLLPLDGVALPDIALPVDGRYPGDVGYPLSLKVSVGIRGNAPELRRWLESLPETDAPSARIRWIGAVGDIMPARGVDAVLLSPGGEKRTFGDTLPILRGTELLVGNLEAAATGGGVRAVKSFTFRFDPRALEVLAGAGFSFLSLANNHTFDFGRAGFLDTLQAVEQAGISAAGAGRTLREASRPAVIATRDGEIRVLSFADYPVDRTGFDGRRAARAAENAPGTLWLDAEGFAAASSGFSRDAFNIALVHGGVEWSADPTDEQKRSYRELVSAGADLVIGSHPHVLQGLEARDGSCIAYSLGNFIFPGMEGTPGGQLSAILIFGTYGKQIVSVRVVPVHLDGGSVRLDPGDAVTRQIRSLSRLLAVPKDQSAGVQ
jgi:hypothetical protein